VVSSSDWKKRSIDYYLEQSPKISIVLPHKNKILIGDSIYKDANSFKYFVFRKNSKKQFVFLHQIDDEDIYSPIIDSVSCK
jgi:hypothetical protein